MTREEAIELFFKQFIAARVVLDSGFGSNPGENDILYRRRKEMAEIALTALSTLQAENEKLQKMYQEEKVVCHEIQLELERMKKIMRENGIMVIPSEYPGSTEKWNIQKPRDKKEEL